VDNRPPATYFDPFPVGGYNRYRGGDRDRGGAAELRF